jgi:predicted CoA-binding protein
MTYSDESITEILTRVRTIALVGMSNKADRPSHGVARFLQDHGYRVIPVNPGLAGQELLGEQVYASLSDIPHDVDMVDIFRQPDAVPGIVDDALARWADLQVIWMQLGVEHAGAAQVARARGVTVIQDRCPKIEYARLRAA